METDPSGPAPEISHAIEYQEFASRRSNPDLRGKGTLVIRGTGPAATFTFSGEQRRMFSLRRDLALVFRADQISNVTTAGRGVEFIAGTPAKPFVFFCASAEAATAVARLLPDTKDAEFFAAQDFGAKLSRLPGASSPWTSVTGLIIAANVAVFLAMGFLGAGWIEVADMMPYVRYGANNGGATTDGEWWRLLTSMFLHYGIIHLLLNLWALFQAGQLLEKLIGRALYALVYFGSGLTGSLVTLLWHGDKMWSAGASGAVFGVYGALLGYMLREKHALPKSVYQPGLKSALTFAGYNLFYGMVHPKIDNAAHLGGLLGGLVLGWLVAVPVDPEPRLRLIPQRLRLGAAVLVAAIAAGVIAAPRYDYRLGDELDWGRAVRDPVAREPEIIRRQEAAFKTYRAGPDEPNA